MRTSRQAFQAQIDPNLSWRAGELAFTVDVVRRQEIDLLEPSEKQQLKALEPIAATPTSLVSDVAIDDALTAGSGKRAYGFFGISFGSACGIASTICFGLIAVLGPMMLIAAVLLLMAGFLFALTGGGAFAQGQTEAKKAANAALDEAVLAKLEQARALEDVAEQRRQALKDAAIVQRVDNLVALSPTSTLQALTSETFDALPFSQQARLIAHLRLDPKVFAEFYDKIANRVAWTLPMTRLLLANVDVGAVAVYRYFVFGEGADTAYATALGQYGTPAQMFELMFPMEDGSLQRSESYHRFALVHGALQRDESTKLTDAEMSDLCTKQILEHGVLVDWALGWRVIQDLTADERATFAQRYPTVEKAIEAGA
jgi:hypothetical protein